MLPNKTNTILFNAFEKEGQTRKKKSTIKIAYDRGSLPKQTSSVLQAFSITILRLNCSHVLPIYDCNYNLTTKAILCFFPFLKKKNKIAYEKCKR